jgi:pyruvate formate lyase activating enzyme
MAVLNVSNIQRFSTGDGPGIRTTVFLKGCNLHCPWCHNPENISPSPQTLDFKAAGKTATYGVIMTPLEVADDVSEDAEFYNAGGGGVTLSGGEPMLQYEGAAELAAILKERGIGTLIDTAGSVPWGNFEAVLGCVNDFYFDIKAGSREKYAALTGGDFDLIVSNLKKLVARGASVTARIPFIPGVNTSDEELRLILKVLLDAGVGRADLIPFHRLGSAKYAAMGLDYPFAKTLPPAAEEVARAAELLGKYIETGIE